MQDGLRSHYLIAFLSTFNTVQIHQWLAIAIQLISNTHTLRPYCDFSDLRLLGAAYMDVNVMGEYGSLTKYEGEFAVCMCITILDFFLMQELTMQCLPDI